MRRLFALLSIILAAMFLAPFGAHADEMSLISESIKAGEPLSLNQVYNDWGAGGKNLSPQLSWSGAPEGTKSFAVTMYDPDAPTGSGWWHWVVFNIPADIALLPEGASRTAAMPPGSIESLTDYGVPGYGGACPPVGDPAHRYIVTVWALNVASLPLNEKSPAAMVGYYLNQHKLDQASIMGTYSR